MLFAIPAASGFGAQSERQGVVVTIKVPEKRGLIAPRAPVATNKLPNRAVSRVWRQVVRTPRLLGCQCRFTTRLPLYRHAVLKSRSGLHHGRSACVTTKDNLGGLSWPIESLSW